MKTKVKKVVNKKSVFRRIRSGWEFYLFVLPLVVYLVLFRYIPMAGIVVAFEDFSITKGVFGSEWVGFKWFERFFNSFYFETVLVNTLTITSLSLLLTFPIPILLALLLDEAPRKLKKVVQTVTFAPHFISTVVLCGMVLIFLSPSSGVVNHLIAALGGERINFMQESNLFKWVYVLSDIWQEMGWNSIIFVAALSNVDGQQLEAACIDGASRLQRVLYVKVPTILPTIVTLLILKCGSIMSLGQDKILLLQNDTNIEASEVIATYVYKTGLISQNYSMSTAVGLFNSVVNIIMLLIVNKISKKLSETSLW